MPEAVMQHAGNSKHVIEARHARGEVGKAMGMIATSRKTGLIRPLSFIALSVLLLLAGLLVGCDGGQAAEAAAQSEAIAKRGSGQTPSGPIMYHFTNKTGGPLRRVAMETPTVPHSWGVVAVDDTDSIRAKHPEVFDRINIHWTDEKGKAYSKKFDLHRELGKTYHGSVTFTAEPRGRIKVRAGD